MSASERLVLGIDIGGTNMRFALVDGKQNMTAFERLSTQSVFVGVDHPTQKLAECIRDYCSRNLNGKMPVAVSIGFPSTINRDRTVVVQTPNIACIPDNYAVVEELGNALGVPVYINRDVNDLLLFDLVDLGLTDCDCVAGIYFGTGIGNAVLVNGKIMLGRNGVAAELGHLPVYGNKKICKCGNTGCLETVVSGVALEQIQAEHFPETSIRKIFAEHTDSPIIKEFVEGMGQAVATEVNLFDPDCVVVGGGLLQMEGFPKEMLEAAIHFYTRKPYPEANLDIRYSRPNQANGTVGAAIYAYKRMADPKYL